MPSLSVVITAGHDRQSGLVRSTDSLLTASPAGQPEIIVAACGCPDAARITSCAAAVAGRGRVLTLSQVSAAAARTAGLAAASGDYVGFLEAGDEVSPGWAQTLTAAAAHRPAIVRGEARVLHEGREHPSAFACARMARSTPLHWYGELGSAIYRRDFVQGHALRFAADGPAGEADFQVRAVVAALLDREQIALCPQAVCRRLITPEGSQAGRSLVAGSLGVYAALHELFVQHAAALPPAGVGLQYMMWIISLFDLARCAEYPQDGAAANALAQRLLQENPCPDEYDQERQAMMSAHRTAPKP